MAFESNEKGQSDNKEPENKQGSTIAIWIPIGVGFGVALGLVLGNLALMARTRLPVAQIINHTVPARTSVVGTSLAGPAAGEAESLGGQVRAMSIRPAIFL
jgi:hypothetical protein